MWGKDTGIMIILIIMLTAAIILDSVAVCLILHKYRIHKQDNAGNKKDSTKNKSHDGFQIGGMNQVDTKNKSDSTNNQSNQ
jgi:hypothetical protein